MLKNEPVEIVDNTRILGTIISSDLSWDLNTASIVKKANARMQPVSFGIPVEDITNI